MTRHDPRLTAIGFDLDHVNSSVVVETTKYGLIQIALPEGLHASRVALTITARDAVEFARALLSCALAAGVR